MSGYKDACDYGFGEHCAILGKRLLALPSKMIGFKPFCLYLATWLLVSGKIGEWVWFSVMIAESHGLYFGKTGNVSKLVRQVQ